MILNSLLWTNIAHIDNEHRRYTVMHGVGSSTLFTVDGYSYDKRINVYFALWCYLPRRLS